MVRKKLAIAILALSALQAEFASALGLGNLSIKSALNQPLSAEIKLLDMGDLDPSQIKIQLAAPEDFQRAGVDRDFFLTNLRFSVDMDGKGGGTIKVSTREPVIEPYLNFVIEARWPNGRLLREFAVLLDPPTFSANKAPAPIAPATSSGAQTAKPKAVQPPTVKTETEVTKSAPPADMSLPATGNAGEYRIQVYDTLSKIAARFKPAGDVSVAQTMIAIQRANPQVFIRNNVNLIKSGYVLRLPSADETRAIAADQAAQDVGSQTQEWRGGSSGARAASSAPAVGPQLDASAPEPSKKEGGYQEKARLSIATAGDSSKGSGADSSGKGISALRDQLTASQESLEKGKRDNKELQSRLDDMERQIATLQRLISLKDDQLAALQAKSAQTKSMPIAPAQTTPPAATAPAPATTAPAPAPAVETPTAPPPTTAAVPEPKPQPPAPAAVKPAPVPEPSFIDQLMANPMYLFGGAAALVLALVGLVVAKRRKAAAEEEESFAFDEGDNFQFDSDTLDNASISDDAIVAATDEPAAKTVVAEMPAEPAKKAVRSETGDAIAESDIYIAYGRYQQAVDLLSGAIDAEPNRSDLRVKLLEVYVEMRNKDAFRKQFVALQSLGDSGAIAHVKDMLSSVDGISDWLDDLPGGSSSSSLFAAPAAAAVAATVAAAVSNSEPEIDLDLVLPDAMADESMAADFDSGEALAFKGAIEDEPEFDLDLDEEAGSNALLEEDLSSSFTEPTPTSRFDNTFEASALQSSGSFDNGMEAAVSDGGLELDLGDDDLDQALSRMDNAENLGDLEDMSTALDDLETPAAIEQTHTFSSDLVDLEGDDLGALPEEFDLSQASTELPDIDRFDAGDFESATFEAPSQPSAEVDVFASLNPAPASAEAVATESAAQAQAPTLEGGDDFDFLADADEVATKLDLARAYIDRGDTDGAKDILDEVLQEGTDTQKEEASTLLTRIG